MKTSPSELHALVAFIYFFGFAVNAEIVYVAFDYFKALPKWFSNFTKIYNELDINKSQNLIYKPSLLKNKLNYLLTFISFIIFLIFSIGPIIYFFIKLDLKSFIIGLVSNIFVVFLQFFILNLIETYIKNYIEKNYKKSIINYMKSFENKINGFSVYPEIMNEGFSTSKLYKKFDINDYFKIKGFEENQIKLKEIINHKINI